MPKARDGGVQLTQEPRRSVPVWDAPTRLFHWLLAVLVCAGWATGQLGILDVHMRIGESILALVIFRIAWGLAGSRHSRFRDFVVGPRAIRAHMREMLLVLRRGPGGTSSAGKTGHSALGGWMILTMLLVFLAQAGAGLFASDEIMIDGPLNHLAGSAAAKLLTSIHWYGSRLILVLVLAHVAAALFYLLRKRENLILPLITGRKSVPESAAATDTRHASPWLALVLLALSVALVWGIISL
jgi:cytochrome b